MNKEEEMKEERQESGVGERKLEEGVCLLTGGRAGQSRAGREVGREKKASRWLAPFLLRLPPYSPLISRKLLRSSLQHFLSLSLLFSLALCAAPAITPSHFSTLIYPLQNPLQDSF